MGPAASGDQTGSQVNFYYGAPAPYAESIAPSHHSTYAHYYDDEEDGWEMPNFYNETYMKGKCPPSVMFWAGSSLFLCVQKVSTTAARAAAVAAAELVT